MLLITIAVVATMKMVTMMMIWYIIEGEEEEEEEGGEASASKESLAKERTKEFNKLREDLLRSKRAVQVLTGADAEKLSQSSKGDLLNPLEQRRQKYLKRKKEHGNREEDTLNRLKEFSSSLKRVKAEGRGSNDKDQSKAGGGGSNKAIMVKSWSVTPAKMKMVKK